LLFDLTLSSQLFIRTHNEPLSIVAVEKAENVRIFTYEKAVFIVGNEPSGYSNPITAWEAVT